MKGLAKHCGFVLLHCVAFSGGSADSGGPAQHTRICLNTYVHTCMHTCVKQIKYTFIHICIYVCIYIYIYIHIYIYIYRET